MDTPTVVPFNAHFRPAVEARDASATAPSPAAERELARLRARVANCRRNWFRRRKPPAATWRANCTTAWAPN